MTLTRTFIDQSLMFQTKESLNCRFNFVKSLFSPRGLCSTLEAIVNKCFLCFTKQIIIYFKESIQVLTKDWIFYSYRIQMIDISRNKKIESKNVLKYNDLMHTQQQICLLTIIKRVTHLHKFDFHMQGPPTIRLC